MKQKIAHNAMPIAYTITAVVLVIGFLKIIVWFLSAEAWNEFWERM